MGASPEIVLLHWQAELLELLCASPLQVNECDPARQRQSKGRPVHLYSTFLYTKAIQSA